MKNIKNPGFVTIILECGIVYESPCLSVDEICCILNAKENNEFFRFPTSQGFYVPIDSSVVSKINIREIS